MKVSQTPETVVSLSRSRGPTVSTSVSFKKYEFQKCFALTVAESPMSSRMRWWYPLYLAHMAPSPSLASSKTHAASSKKIPLNHSPYHSWRNIDIEAPGKTGGHSSMRGQHRARQDTSGTFSIFYMSGLHLCILFDSYSAVPIRCRSNKPGTRCSAGEMA